MAESTSDLSSTLSSVISSKKGDVELQSVSHITESLIHFQVVTPIWLEKTRFSFEARQCEQHTVTIVLRGRL